MVRYRCERTCRLRMPVANVRYRGQSHGHEQGLRRYRELTRACSPKLIQLTATTFHGPIIGAEFLHFARQARAPLSRDNTATEQARSCPWFTVYHAPLAANACCNEATPPVLPWLLAASTPRPRLAQRAGAAPARLREAPGEALTLLRGPESGGKTESMTGSVFESADGSILTSTEEGIRRRPLARRKYCYRPSRNAHF